MAWPSRLTRTSRRSNSLTRTGPRLRGPVLAFGMVAALFGAASLFGAQDKQPAGYAGSDTCQGCHDEISKAFQKNPHQFVETDKKRGFETRACESCHGPGAKHAESASAGDIVNPAKLPVAKADQTCLKCHLNQPTQIGRLRGGHGKNQVACVACHSVHKGNEKLRPTKFSSVNQECASCHPSVWAQFQKPYKHRLPEGAMSCVDCHNPHGGFLPRMVQTVSANEPGCFKCHGNLRGPFTYEHAPVRLGQCSQCHEPHGSANPRMLVRHEVRFVCLECHSNVGVAGTAAKGPAKTLGGIPPAFHDLRNPRFQNCTICHMKIHGSYVSPTLTR
jgi:DmsE family decaheme c-type cytochrome